MASVLPLMGLPLVPVKEEGEEGKGDGKKGKGKGKGKKGKGKGPTYVPRQVTLEMVALEAVPREYHAAALLSKLGTYR